MPRIKFTGLDEYIEKISKLNALAEVYVEKAIGEGAKVVADNTKKALQNIPVDNRGFVPYRTSINQKQKNGLIESFGIASLRRDGNFINVKTGFDGYNGIITKRWPQGQPNVVIARTLESGTSFMPKNPVITNATRESKDAVLKAMEESLIKSIEELMK